jgi:signal transduction histidine kinase
MTFNLSRISLPARFALGVAGIAALSLLIFYLMMHPPMSDLGLMALYLSLTAVISIAAGYGAYRLGWMHRLPSLRWTLIGGYALSSGLTFLNVSVTAYLMFASLHDLQLATVLLLFATGIAVALGIFLSNALTGRIAQLEQAAQSIAQGDLNVRLELGGQDEIAHLARTFTQMTHQLSAAAEQQRQLDALRRDLIAWVSHDLHTPLTSIRAVLEALADGVVEDPATVQRYLLTAQKDIGALSLLIDDLFQMAQLDAGGLALDVEPNSLADLISDTLESFSELAARQQVQLSGEVAPGLAALPIDAQRIGRALNNLVANALRHTPPGGSIQVRAWREASQVTVEVQDSGEGIPPEDLAHVFDRFYRSEKSRSRTTGGAGLGLTIARGFIEAHQGTIRVESEPNQGARFIFTLPAQAGYSGASHEQE